MRSRQLRNKFPPSEPWPNFNLIKFPDIYGPHHNDCCCYWLHFSITCTSACATLVEEMSH